MIASTENRQRKREERTRHQLEEEKIFGCQQKEKSIIQIRTFKCQDENNIKS